MKKRKSYSELLKQFTSSIATLSIALGMVFSHNAFAAEPTKSTKYRATEAETPSSVSSSNEVGKAWELGRGWKLTSTGGLVYEHPNDSRYWFKLTGALRFDETMFMGSYRDKAPINGKSFANGAHIRAAQVYMDGGIGENWEYTLSLDFSGRYVGFSDTWISYLGLLAEKNQIFVGRVPGNWFGLDNSNSTSWNPFLERSLPALGLFPGDGLGAMTDFWWDCGGLTISAFQPDRRSSNLMNNPVTYTNGPKRFLEVRDRWTVVGRATFAPVHEMGDVWHFGISGAWKEVVSAVDGLPVDEYAFSVTGPSARTRNIASPLNTGFIRMNNARYLNVEMARQCGPFVLEGEYTEVYVHRLASNYGTVQFHGWNLQTRYLLTGESHEYDVRDGAFGSVKPHNDFGAFEVAARYDFINLNRKDIRGGSQHDVTVGLNWFVNSNIRLSANYIRASIHPANDVLKRHLNIIGMRCQLRFK